MLESQKIELRRSKIRERLGEISKLEGDAYTDEVKTEEGSLQDEIGTLEQRHRTAVLSEDEEAATAAAETEAGAAVKPEERERLQLRSRARFGSYILSAIQGRQIVGTEAEYAAACGVAPGHIPLDLFEEDRPQPETRAETRVDVATTVPGSGLGATLAPISPFVFSESIAPRLGISMPSAPSGAYSEATISTSLTAAPKAKGAAQESTAAVITPTTANPRRISARLTTQIEDVAQIGVGNYEAALRMNAMSRLSDEYDRQCISGDGTAPAVNGLINQLADPTDPTVISDFDNFVSSFVDQVDGLWAATGRDVAIVTNAECWRLSAKSFRDIAAADLGSMAFSDYAASHFGGWWCNSRMPATASMIARGIVYRKGRTGLRTAAHPTWGSMSVSDVFSDAASGQTHFTLHVLVGDKVLIIQPAAYDLVEFKVA